MTEEDEEGPPNDRPSRPKASKPDDPFEVEDDDA
jgi:hypothetical protein